MCGLYLRADNPRRITYENNKHHTEALIHMAKVFTIPVAPKTQGPRRRERTSDSRYVDGQKMLVEAMKYLAKADPVSNRGAIEWISEHVRTRFRMTDSPLG